METSGNVRRGGEAGGLSLGALLAIALCGGVFLFTSIGLLMAWVIKNRQKKSSARVYTIPDEYSQTRLTKRPLTAAHCALAAHAVLQQLQFLPDTEQEEKESGEEELGQRR